MDRGREKRKKSEKEIEDGKKKKVSEADGEEAAAAGGSATEEEVDEFFAILKRMQDAIKYFERGNEKGGRAALEADVLAVAGAGGDERKEEKIKKAAEETAMIFDLNVTPEVGEQ